MKSDVLALIRDPATAMLWTTHSSLMLAVDLRNFSLIKQPAGTFLFATAFRFFFSRAKSPARIEDIRRCR
jgi:hypothetical protein